MFRRCGREAADRREPDSLDGSEVTEVRIVPVSRTRPMPGFLFRACLAVVAWFGAIPSVLADDTAPATMADSPAGQVLVLPWDSEPGTEDVGELRAEIAHENGFRVYRVEFQGRTYSTHRSLDGRRRPVAFVPSEGRFADVLPELKVALTDSTDLDDVVEAAGARHGKAYPPGWALLRLPPDLNPSEVAAALRSHPSVTGVEVLLRRPRFRALQTQDDDSSYKDSPAADPSIEVVGVEAAYEGEEEEPDPDSLVIVGLYENLGAARSSAATVAWTVHVEPPSTGSDVVLSGTLNANADSAAVLQGEVSVPALDPAQDWDIDIRIHTTDLPDISEGTSYYVQLEIGDTPEEPDRNRDNNTALFGFALGSGSASGGTSNFLVRCNQVASRGQAGTSQSDPFVDQQWNLDNTGQNAWARNGGTSGEDLNMRAVMADPSAPTGAGVRMAIVDTGLETCHPDLEANVEAGKSWNFLAPNNPVGSLRFDPFNPNTTGDHGTSVAGVAGAVADNGIGGRGVAAEVLLRGYNFLPAQHYYSSYYDSLGMSRVNPDSTGVDIFNMSFDSVGSAMRAPT